MISVRNSAMVMRSINEKQLFGSEKLFFIYRTHHHGGIPDWNHTSRCVYNNYNVILRYVELAGLGAPKIIVAVKRRCLLRKCHCHFLEDSTGLVLLYPLIECAKFFCQEELCWCNVQAITDYPNVITSGFGSFHYSIIILQLKSSLIAFCMFLSSTP